MLQQTTRARPFAACAILTCPLPLWPVLEVSYDELLYVAAFLAAQAAHRPPCPSLRPTRLARAARKGALLAPFYAVKTCQVILRVFQLWGGFGLGDGWPNWARSPSLEGFPSPFKHRPFAQWSNEPSFKKLPLSPSSLCEMQLAPSWLSRGAPRGTGGSRAGLLAPRHRLPLLPGSLRLTTALTRGFREVSERRDFAWSALKSGERLARWRCASVRGTSFATSSSCYQPRPCLQ